MRQRRLLTVLLVPVSASAAVSQQSPPDLTAAMPAITSVPLAARPSDHFSPEATTDAYMRTDSGQCHSRSDAYFEGGYWLKLWDFVDGVAVALLLLNFRRKHEPESTRLICMG